MPHSVSPQDVYCTSGNSPTVRSYGPESGPVVLVLGGISASPDLHWWPGIVGPGAPVDLSRYRVLSVGWITHHDATPHTQARRILEVLDDLGITRLHAAVGCSYGGMVALALGEIAPARAGRIVAIAAAHRPHPLATAWRWIQRRVALFGERGEGLALARALAMTSYRSARELDARFAGRTEALEAWLSHHGEKFSEQFTADEFVALSGAIDRHRVEPEGIHSPTTVVGFDSDQLAPPWLLDELCSRLPRSERVELKTVYGHDGFLKETALLAPILRRVLTEELEVAA